MSVNIIKNKVISFIVKKENREMLDLREEGRLLYLAELIPHFRDKNIFTFANGGSVSNLEDISRVREKNLMSVHDGPFHFYNLYGFMPNIWYLHYAPSAQVVLEHEKKKALDFSDTFILVPANDSQSVVFFSSPAIKEFRAAHPEATFVLYREKRNSSAVDDLSQVYLEPGVEPLQSLGVSTLHNVFMPICAFWGVSSLYFSGVDNLPTGHFYDRDRPYQAINGKLLDFPDKDITLSLDVEARKLCEEKGLNVFRLEKEETLFTDHTYKGFDEAIEEASSRISPAMFQANNV